MQIRKGWVQNNRNILHNLVKTPICLEDHLLAFLINLSMFVHFLKQKITFSFYCIINKPTSSVAKSKIPHCLVKGTQIPQSGVQRELNEAMQIAVQWVFVLFPQTQSWRPIASLKQTLQIASFVECMLWYKRFGNNCIYLHIYA